MFLYLFLLYLLLRKRGLLQHQLGRGPEHRRRDHDGGTVADARAGAGCAGISLDADIAVPRVVGAGRGVLTGELARHTRRLVAYEVDPQVAAELFELEMDLEKNQYETEAPVALEEPVHASWHREMVQPDQGFWLHST